MSISYNSNRDFKPGKDNHDAYADMTYGNISLYKKKSIPINMYNRGQVSLDRISSISRRVLSVNMSSRGTTHSINKTFLNFTCVCYHMWKGQLFSKVKAMTLAVWYYSFHWYLQSCIDIMHTFLFYVIWIHLPTLNGNFWIFFAIAFEWHVTWHVQVERYSRKYLCGAQEVLSLNSLC